MKPTPTDYSGTRFRSKSEAIIARAMDLAEIEWIYEPDKFDGYTPDFAVDLSVPGWSSLSLSYLIEYKPSRPTDAYMENIGKKVITDPYDGFFVLYGSQYNREDGFGIIQVGGFTPSETGCFALCFVDRVLKKMSEAFSYRFDLAA